MDYYILGGSMLCCCCQPTLPCLSGCILPYFAVTGHPVPVSSLGFKCPDCFIWNCSFIVYPSKIKESFRDNYLRYFYLWFAFLMAGCVEGIRRALVLGLVLIAGTDIEQAPSVGHLAICYRHNYCFNMISVASHIDQYLYIKFLTYTMSYVWCQNFSNSLS